MQRILLSILALVSTFTASEAHAARRSVQHAPLSRSERIGLMQERRAVRRAVRLKRIQAMLSRVERRRNLRLSRRRLRQERPVTESELTLTSFPQIKESGTTEVRQSVQSAKEGRDDDLLPNQTFTPTLPLPEIDAQSNFLLLGGYAPVMGTIKLTPDDEPVEVREIKITLNAAASSLSSLEVFDELGYVLGTASLDLDASANRNVFTLNLSPKRAYHIEKDAEIIIAIRPRLKARDSGGVSGQSIKISRIEVIAIGLWSSNQNLVETSGPDFQEHVSSLAEITAIKNVGKTIGTFPLGTHKRIGYFEFHAKSIAHADADPALESLSFSVNTPSEVTVSNPSLLGDDGASTSSCTIASSIITCSSIPANIGNLQSPRKISVYADIAVSGHENPFLQIELNRPGGPTSAGDITWTDGETSFDWVPLDGPVAQGTSWE